MLFRSAEAANARLRAVASGCHENTVQLCEGFCGPAIACNSLLMRFDRDHLVERPMIDRGSSRPLEELRILVVEDEYLIAAQLVDELELLGARVVGPSPTLERALELVSNEQVDLA